MNGYDKQGKRAEDAIYFEEVERERARLDTGDTWVRDGRDWLSMRSSRRRRSIESLEASKALIPFDQDVTLGGRFPPLHDRNFTYIRDLVHEELFGPTSMIADHAPSGPDILLIFFLQNPNSFVLKAKSTNADRAKKIVHLKPNVHAPLFPYPAIRRLI